MEVLETVDYIKMTKTKVKTAITPTRAEDFSEWYQQVLKAADMAENSPVRGSMVIKPHGFAIWEELKRYLDGEIKRTGHQNAYFPLFIPLSFLEKEAEHVEGFAKECAVVTHCRLQEIDGKLVPTCPLEEPLVVRPTSETIIGECYSRWINSWRDLPVLINQWANVVRWEMRPRIFLRTTEFLWQEGHTAHATEEEALEETFKMLEVYRKLCEEFLAIPVITGEKSPGERFPGAVNTYTFETMMQDGKALQGGTSHYLGQKFSKASGIEFDSKDGKREFAYTTSWGATTRLIGAMIMVHGDDDGLRIPPRIAPEQVVVIPIVPKPEMEASILEYAEKIAARLRESSFSGEPVRVRVDKRDMRGGEKMWNWVKKGAPIRIEVGPREVEENTVSISRRDQPPKEKSASSLDELAGIVPTILQEIQDNYFSQAKVFRDQNIYDHVKSFSELEQFFAEHEKKSGCFSGGFVLGKWCGDPESEEELKKLKLTIRCIPSKQRGDSGTCLITGKPATLDVIIAKAY